MNARGVRRVSGALLSVAVVGTWLAVATTGPALAGQTGPNLVFNHSFETPDVGSGAVTFVGGSSFDGWTVTGVSIDLVGTIWEAATGKQSVDLSGGNAGGLYQDLATTPGQTYGLAFAMSGNHHCGARYKYLAVKWNGARVAQFRFDTDGIHDPDMGWAPRGVKMLPAATGTTTRLQFLSLSRGTCGPVIDDIFVGARS
jgi:choice-of-anchor C domain-containing protein